MTYAADDLRVIGKAALTGRRVGSARVPLADANQTVKVTDGQRFELADPAAPRTITLSSTTPTPDEGETFEFIIPVISGGGTQFTFQRADTTVVATVVGPTVSGQPQANFVQFEFVSGVWRIGANSGSAYDGGAPADYGVIPGPGA